MRRLPGVHPAFALGWVAMGMVVGLAGGALNGAPPEFRHAVPPPPILDPSPDLGPEVVPEALSERTSQSPVPSQNVPPGDWRTALFRTTRLPEEDLPTPSAVGPPTQVGFRFAPPEISSSLLQQSFEPQNADLKVGPFYFKLLALEGAVLHSDNINLTQNAESGTIAAVTLTVGMIAQITEGLRLSLSGSVYYFPLEGKIGLVGLNNYGISGPLTRAQIFWNTEIGGWNVVFGDEFHVLVGSYSNNLGTGFDGASTAGRYSFSAPRNTNDSRPSFRNEFFVLSNTVSVAAERLLPGTVRLRVRLFHEDLWYNQGNRGLPSLREGATVVLASERENMRFKPYAIYEALRTSRDDDFQHTFRLGFEGPITPQVHLLAEAGYSFGGSYGETLLWRAELQHTAGPYTQESLYYGRSFNYFQDEINEGVGYTIHQLLGPKLSGDAYIDRLNIEGRRGSQTTQSQWRAGARLTYTPGPKTIFRLEGDYAVGEPGKTEVWTGRMDVAYSFSGTLLAHFVYQYQQSNSSLPGQIYTENLFFLSLTKYFE